MTGIARAGVEAAKTGRFGTEGARVTEREAEFVRELARELGATAIDLNRRTYAGQAPRGPDRRPMIWP